MVCGNPGEGKSIFMFYLTAMVTSGKPLPDGHTIYPNGSVVYCTYEDAPDVTIKRFVRIFGGNCERVKVISGIEDVDGSWRSLNLRTPEGIGFLRDTCASMDNIKMIVLDPVSDFAGLKTENDNEKP